MYLNSIVFMMIVDMVNSVKPDERSVMAYVSSYYHAFSGAQQVKSQLMCIKNVQIASRSRKLLREIITSELCMNYSSTMKNFTSTAIAVNYSHVKILHQKLSYCPIGKQSMLKM